MLSKILGTLTIIGGFFWLIKPESLKNRIKRKINRKIRWAVYGFIAVFGFLIAGSVIKAPGFLPKIAGLIGLIIAVKAILLITSNTSEKMLDWLSDRPILFFRIWALLILSVGIILILS